MWRLSHRSRGAGLLGRRWASSCAQPQTSAELVRIMDEMPPERVRNFCIVAHVDHGKSTLADRLMEMCGAVGVGVDRAQLLDDLAVEKERGITVKARTVSLIHQNTSDGLPYLLNLIDTPGHVDFSYETSRSIAACQGALLLVDACQGVQAQTVANFWLAFEQNLSITPVINKVDLPHADIPGTVEQMEAVFGVEAEEVVAISAKTGLGTTELLGALLERTPPPAASRDRPLRVLLFDSWYDEYRGVLCLVQVLDGVLCVGDQLLSAATGKTYPLLQIELMRPSTPVALRGLYAGQVGCISLGMKHIVEANVGDMLSAPSAPQAPLEGFKRPQPMVFAGFYPSDEQGFEALQHAMGRFCLQDGSVRVESDHSPTLGRGLRCGFLGMLHMEVVQQRLEQEHGVNVIVTAPTVPLEATLSDGSIVSILSPEALPEGKDALELREPLVKVTLITPTAHLGAISQLCIGRSGELCGESYLGPERVMVQYTLPLAEIATDFHDRVKTLSQGYASLDYEPAGTQPADVVALGLKVNGNAVAALTRIVRRPNAERMGREMAMRLKGELSRQVYDIVIQATIGIRVVARETIRASRKDVLAKCYGGDVSRKKKLLEKLKAGKKKRQMHVGDVPIPHGAFVKVLTPAK